MKEVLAAARVSKRFGDTVALHDVSFTLEGPQVIGVLGPNGAGKTTLLEILEGLSSADEGEVRVFGERLDPRRYPRRRVGVVMQREFALDQITVAEYAELFAAIYEVDGGAKTILARADLESRAGTALERISGGEAQRLFLAAAVVHRPELIFLDEPTGQLDPESKERIGQEIRALARSSTVVMTTHDLREVDAVCDHVLFLVDGELKAQGRRETLIAEVPEDARRGTGIEAAFFHHCGVGIGKSGARE
jgi:ABC-2 type transport system ATP-binding protein